MVAKLLPTDMDTPKRGIEPVRLRTVAPDTDGRIGDPDAARKLKPTSGLLLGLTLGIILWLGLLIFAWQFFRKVL